MIFYFCSKKQFSQGKTETDLPNEPLISRIEFSFF
jgi:hypothetical protein